MRAKTIYDRSIDKSRQFARIYRRPAGTDPFGQPLTHPAGLVPDAGLIPCRVAFRSSMEKWGERYVDLVGDARLIFFKSDVDIDETCEVEVLGADDSVIEERGRVEGIRRRRDGEGRVLFVVAVYEAERNATFQGASN